MVSEYKIDSICYVILIIVCLIYVYTKSQSKIHEEFSCCNEKFKSMDLLKKRISQMTTKANSLRTTPLSNIANSIRNDAENNLFQANQDMDTLQFDVNKFNQLFKQYHPSKRLRKQQTTEGKKRLSQVEAN